MTMRYAHLATTDLDACVNVLDRECYRPHISKQDKGRKDTSSVAENKSFSRQTMAAGENFG